MTTTKPQPIKTYVLECRGNLTWFTDLAEAKAEIDNVTSCGNDITLFGLTETQDEIEQLCFNLDYPTIYLCVKEQATIYEQVYEWEVWFNEETGKWEELTDGGGLPDYDTEEEAIEASRPSQYMINF